MIILGNTNEEALATLGDLKTLMEQEVYGSVVEQPEVGTTTFHFKKALSGPILILR